MKSITADEIELRVLESPDDIPAVEELEGLVWPGIQTVPGHIYLAIGHNGGVLIGAYHEEKLIGFVFGFPGLYETEQGIRPKHCSHMMGVHPNYRDFGVGYKLKRAQWQLVRQQGLELITWTYDPLESRNAVLNITKLGAVCSTYLRNIYGELEDELNVGIPTDRFQVDWWVNTQRVEKRLSRKSRQKLDLAHFLAADVEIINQTKVNKADFLVPGGDDLDKIEDPSSRPPITLVKIPANFQDIKSADLELAQEWRFYTRNAFERLFENGYIVTDVVYLPGSYPSAYYVFTHGETTLGF